MQTLRARYEYSNPSKVKQEVDELQNVRFLLLLNHEGLPASCQQDRFHGHKANNRWRKILQNWKICDKEASHTFQLVPESNKNLQKQAKRNNAMGSTTKISSSKLQGRCSSNWWSYTVSEKKREDAKSQKPEKQEDPFIYSYKPCDSPGRHIERYRQEVTLKAMQRKFPVPNSDNQAKSAQQETLPKSQSTPVHTRECETREKQEPTPTAKSSYHTRKSPKGYCTVREQTRKQNSKHKKRETEQNVWKRLSNVRAYNIPCITLPSLPIDKVMKHYKKRCQSGGKRTRSESNPLPKIRDKRTHGSKEQCIKIVSKIEYENRVQKLRHDWLSIENSGAFKKKSIPLKGNDDCLLTSMNRFVIK